MPDTITEQVQTCRITTARRQPQPLQRIKLAHPLLEPLPQRDGCTIAVCQQQDINAAAIEVVPAYQ